MILGKTINKEIVESGTDVNGHVVAIGVSGTGKSSALFSMILQRAREGKRSVVINWHNSAALSSMPPCLAEIYVKNRIVLDAANGIPVPLFETFCNEYGVEEPPEMLVSRVCSVLGMAVKLPPTQYNVLHSAVEDLVQNQQYKPGCGTYAALGIQAVKEKMEKVRGAASRAALAKLRDLFDLNLLVDGKLEFKKPILEIDMNRLERRVQKILLNMLLEFLFLKAGQGVFKEDGIAVFIDEAHNLDYGKDDVIRNMLYESRKLGVELYLATPELPGHRDGISSILQAGTRLYFRQEDTKVRDVAKLIQYSRMEHWQIKLSELDRGEFVACGGYKKDGITYAEPIILSTYIKEDEGSLVS